MKYREIIDNILNAVSFSRPVTAAELTALEDRLVTINSLVIAANGGNQEHNLRSTQVICSIIFEHLKEMGIE